MNFATKDMGKLLMAFFAKQSNPFIQLASNKNALDRKYQDIVNIAVLGYQAYFFLNMIKLVFGEQKHGEVHAQVSELMNSSQTDYDFFETTIKLIDIAVEMGELEVTEQNYTIPVPLERNIALIVLLGLPGSPHYAPQKQSRESEIHHMAEDIDQKVARYLSKGKAHLVEWLTPMTAPITDQLFGASYSKRTLPSR